MASAGRSVARWPVLAVAALLSACTAQSSGTVAEPPIPTPAPAPTGSRPLPSFGTPLAPKPLRPPGGVSATPPPEAFEVILKRSGCFGICPSYELTLHADGTVDFIGRAHVAAAGPRAGRADPARLAALRQRLGSSATAALAGRYVRGEAACGSWATDMPTATVVAWVDGRWLRIEHDWGCAGAPAALKGLEQAIDDAANVSQWISGRPAY